MVKWHVDLRNAMTVVTIKIIKTQVSTRTCTLYMHLVEIKLFPLQIPAIPSHIMTILRGFYFTLPATLMEGADGNFMNDGCYR